jgi:hypothetical protein
LSTGTRFPFTEGGVGDQALQIDISLGGEGAECDTGKD